VLIVLDIRVGSWIVTGDSFGAGPTKGTLPNQQSVSELLVLNRPLNPIQARYFFENCNI
jgi:hypothetical protein